MLVLFAQLFRRCAWWSIFELGAEAQSFEKGCWSFLVLE
jgi:hypothetical protein